MSPQEPNGLLGWEGEKPGPPNDNGSDSGPSLFSSDMVSRIRQITPRNLVSSLLDGLTPEILRRKSGPRRPLSSTAWLDGLRGWAALIVCMVVSFVPRAAKSLAESMS